VTLRTLTIYNSLRAYISIPTNILVLLLVAFCRLVITNMSCRVFSLMTTGFSPHLTRQTL